MSYAPTGQERGGFRRSELGATVRVKFVRYAECGEEAVTRARAKPLAPDREATTCGQPLKRSTIIRYPTPDFCAPRRSRR